MSTPVNGLPLASQMRPGSCMCGADPPPPADGPERLLLAFNNVMVGTCVWSPLRDWALWVSCGTSATRVRTSSQQPEAAAARLGSRPGTPPLAGRLQPDGSCPCAVGGGVGGGWRGWLWGAGGKWAGLGRLGRVGACSRRGRKTKPRPWGLPTRMEGRRGLRVKEARGGRRSWHGAQRR